MYRELQLSTSSQMDGLFVHIANFILNVRSFSQSDPCAPRYRFRRLALSSYVST